MLTAKVCAPGTTFWEMVKGLVHNEPCIICGKSSTTAYITRVIEDGVTLDTFCQQHADEKEIERILKE